MESSDRQSGLGLSFGVSGSHGYTSQPLEPPMWRNGRRNGLKIAVLAISALIETDQIESDLRG